MADIFVSYTRADQEIVRRIVALLEAEGWSVWWDTRIDAGDRWDEVIEREVTAACCVVVVWTPLSVNRRWVLTEAHHGLDRGILVPILIGVDKPPFGFSLIQARNLTGWGGATRTAVADQLLNDVRKKLESAASLASHQAHGRIRIDAETIHGARDGLFKPGAGKSQWFKDDEHGPEMVVVPAGNFTMGSNDYDDEKPPHKVMIKMPFAVGRFAVTFHEWDAAGLPQKPGDERWGRGRRPVINVSWEDAKSYAAWLSQKTRKAYRLLNEAEWEYCCRAGTATQYAFGDSITRQQAQFSEPTNHTVEVGRFPPNAWGIYGMHGNVWEWCEDNWHPNYDDAPNDGSIWAGGDASLRVLRGGAWNLGPTDIRSAYRLRLKPGWRLDDIGFRVARTL